MAAHAGAQGNSPHKPPSSASPSATPKTFTRGGRRQAVRQPLIGPEADAAPWSDIADDVMEVRSEGARVLDPAARLDLCAAHTARSCAAPPPRLFEQTKL